jgi:transglutaminase-like putative cysteine protease
MSNQDPHDDGPTPASLAPGSYVDSDHPAVIAFARQAAGQEGTARERAVRLYYAVRDRIRYDPYVSWTDPESYRASSCLERGYGFCISKASLLAAAARAIGIPSRVAFADVRNHLCTPRLRAMMGTDVFTYHGITELYLDGRWVKATPTFNIELCERFGVQPLDFDGREDSLLHPFDRAGRRHMEYLAYHGAYDEMPFEQVVAAMHAFYGENAHRRDAGSDFAAEAQSEGA